MLRPFTAVGAASMQLLACAGMRDEGVADLASAATSAALPRLLQYLAGSTRYRLQSALAPNRHRAWLAGTVG
jgi:hypothetical protein